MAKEYQINHQVLYYEGDITNQMTMAMLLNVLVLASEGQSRFLGVGHEVLGQDDLGWVVTSYSIDVVRMPKVDENITITTEGTSYNRFFAFRKFWINDQAGNRIVQVQSIWVMINEKTRKLVSIPTEIVAAYESEAVKRIPRLPKPTTLAEITEQKRYQVRYSDIDFNGHVNNAHYLEWVADTLPLTFLATHTPEHIDIRFENEVRYGEMIDSHLQLIKNEEQTISRHEIKDGETVSANAEIKWRSTEKG